VLAAAICPWLASWLAKSQFGHTPASTLFVLLKTVHAPVYEHVATQVQEEDSRGACHPAERLCAKDQRFAARHVLLCC
jgi:hypothetical protein